jgi:hypothetical protein
MVDCSYLKKPFFKISEIAFEDTQSGRERFQREFKVQSSKFKVQSQVVHQTLNLEL